MTNPLPKVLFVCDGVADRAKMAEALLRKATVDSFEIYSAGIESPPLSAWSVKVMQEMNIAMGSQIVDLNDYEAIQFDYVITICEAVNKLCVEFPRDAHNSHWQLADPASVRGTDEQIYMAYQQARDALSVKIEAWLQSVAAH